ncbi:uncharacterized protein LOC113235380 isoform X2 [Hyposmocoma kahamanoa]|uniref:uncharacterized protein LOC113235380 isoform X2 n=1 Tax=Hyposmocoma kahamanoa TaxID=1477025 RepID=UPI000E6D80A4|nr:uncharacterized protein LOC113235380 isoform X2 [Hyposmocoma kahamanoa]
MLSTQKLNFYYLALLEEEELDSEEIDTTYYINNSMRRHRFWLRNHIKYRSVHGEYYTFFQTADEETFENSYRVSRPTFHELHSLVQPYIQKHDSNFRNSISSRERLAVCLKYLATGQSFTGIAENFRIGLKSVSRIIEDVCDVLWNVLQPLVMPEPTENDWKKIAKDFDDLWQFKNCLGALDGSMGRFSDAGIFDDSTFGKRLKERRLNLPQPVPLYQDGEPMPFVFVGDEAFPLMENFMRPYPRDRLNSEKRVFNYRLSRARRIVEATFGVLARKWYVYHKDFECKIATVDKIIKATCVLHNYLIDRQPDFLNNNENYNEHMFISVGNRTDTHNSRNEAYQVREMYCSYFNNQGKVPWQDTRITSRISMNN